MSILIILFLILIRQFKWILLIQETCTIFSWWASYFSLKVLNLNLLLLFSVLNINFSDWAYSLYLVIKVLVPNFLNMYAIIHIFLKNWLIRNIFTWKFVSFLIISSPALNSILNGSSYFVKEWIPFWLIHYWC